jgi:hypothetical protein
MLNVKRLGEADGCDRWHVKGTLENGNAVDAVLETEVDGREAWWDEATSPCETGGVDPGFDETGWEEVLLKVSEACEA